MWRPKEDWKKKRDYWLNTVGGKFADSGEAMEASVIYEAGADAMLKALTQRVGSRRNKGNSGWLIFIPDEE